MAVSSRSFTFLTTARIRDNFEAHGTVPKNFPNNVREDHNNLTETLVGTIIQTLVLILVETLVAVTEYKENLLVKLL